MILFVNACVREQSRTKRLADNLLSFLKGTAEEVRLSDIAFPAALKQYLEQVSVPGITFTYTEDGLLKGLCAADRLYYVTTAGGQYAPEDFGFGYVRALCRDLFGIGQAELIRAVGLDLDGADVEGILWESIREIFERHGGDEG